MDWRSLEHCSQEARDTVCSVEFVVEVEASLQLCTRQIIEEIGAERNADFYLRQVLYDYDDRSAGIDSGTSHMVLGGGGLNW